MSRVGLVAIGRNEGQRLRECLTSVIPKVAHIVYVDSGSTDGSVDLARSLNVNVVELDLSTPFSAARGRNAGFDYLLQAYPQIEFVQFVDGDCEVVEGWLERAKAELEAQPNIAIVCGRRREQYPQLSVYHRLCDIEWNTPIGETKACGGDAMMRVQAFRSVGGFNPTVVAGEEPELCLRLRQQGWKILRVDAEMTLHDVQMLHFHQWWKRALRGGHAYAEGAWLHGNTQERHWVKESLSICFWGLLLPLLALGMVWTTDGLSLLLLGAYPLLTYRIFHRMQQRNYSFNDAWVYALFCVLSKFPSVIGQIKFYWHKQLRQQLTYYFTFGFYKEKLQPKLCK
ncbi:MAG TPA: glycosyltransferase [Oculatellaceae cyanobacterium]